MLRIALIGFYGTLIAAVIGGVATLGAAVIGLIDPPIIINNIFPDTAQSTAVPTANTPDSGAQIATDPVLSTSTSQPSATPAETEDPTQPADFAPMATGADLSFPPDENTVLRLFVDQNSLYILVEGDQPVDLSRVAFEFAQDDARAQFILSDNAQLSFLKSTPISPGTCLLIRRESTQPIAPTECQPVAAETGVTDEEVFWFGDQARAFVVLYGETQVDFCGTSQNSECLIHLDAPPARTVADSVTIKVNWGEHYVAIYVEDDVGVISLDGLQITNDPSTPHSLQEEDAFAGIRFDEIVTPICFYYRVGDAVRAPDGCAPNRRIIENVVAAEAFWYFNANTKILNVLNNGELLGLFCSNTVGTCERAFPQPAAER